MKSHIWFKCPALLLVAAGLGGLAASAQNIAWSGAATITGDANLATNGLYFDAFIPLVPASLTADGVIFNAPTGGDTDGKISYVVTSGSDRRYHNNTAFTGGTAAFNAIMNAGGTFETSGAGAGTVTISGLTTGDAYSVQIFNYAGDGDPGLTTFSGSPSVQLSTEVGGNFTQGQFVTGTFTATGATETFNWNGNGSMYTVLGAISVRELPSASAQIIPVVSPTNAVLAGGVVTLTVPAQSGPTYYQWQTDGGRSGASWSNIAGANSTNYVLNTTGISAGNYEFQVIVTNNSLNVTSSPVTMTVLATPAQNIVWGAAIGISGDANLSTAGAYVDALVPNSSLSSVVVVDGVHFNPAASRGGNLFGDARISYAGSGLNNFSWPNSFPVSATTSASFATLMDDGGTFQNGGSGSGTVTVSGLSSGHDYLVQVFSYAADGDPGLTTLSGAIPATLSNLAGAGGAGTYGEFASGTFTASGAPELFNWNGAGSSYTVIGAISVRDVSAVAVIYPANSAYFGDAVTLAVNAQPGPAYYQWRTDNGSGGATWSNLAGANSTNYFLNTGSLALTNYEFQVIVTNGTLNVTSAPVVLTVLAPAAPVILQNITPVAAAVYVGQQAVFSAAFTGNHPITNQWQVSQDGGSTFASIPGETNATLILTNLSANSSGEYRLAAVNALGSNNTSQASLTVEPWSDAHIQWQGPTSLAGLSAGQILTNAAGIYLEAADFFYGAFITVTAGNQQYVFRPDGVSASISGTPYFAGQFETNAIFGSGALETNSTGDPSFDGVLNQYYDGGISNVITVRNLIPGQQYAVQLFALDNRPGTTAEAVDFADAGDPNDYSPQFAMGYNVSLMGTFIATNTWQTIQENLLTAELGNLNALVVRALSYAPRVEPAIAVQPRELVSLIMNRAVLTVVADGAPAPVYQWQAGPVGGPYTNLTDGGTYIGTKTPALTINNLFTHAAPEFVVTVTNPASGLVSAPVDLVVPTVAQPVAPARPVRINLCRGK